MKRVLIPVLLIASLCVPCGTACALQASTTGNCSLPYVTDVAQLKGDKLLATIEVAGKPQGVVVKLANKRVKVTKHSKHVWSVKLTKGKLYTITAVGKDGKAKTIKYKVERC